MRQMISTGPLKELPQRIALKSDVHYIENIQDDMKERLLKDGANTNGAYEKYTEYQASFAGAVIEKNDMSIGRKEAGASDILIEKSTVSANHARVFISKGRVFLEDAGSKNGTYVFENGEKRRLEKGEAVELFPGEPVRLADYQTSFSLKRR